jgi:hypothetical protein
MEVSKPPTLLKPGAFWQLHNKRLPFRTYSAIKYHLERRHRNGLIESGAVVDSPIGTLVNPDIFLGEWLQGKAARREAA